jgi:tetratricopeptide (TPR) repeat protein
MAGDYKYFAFISYSHADEAVCRWLHRALETYRVPKRLVGRATEFGPVPPRLVPLFRDRDELSGAAELGTRITAALEASQHLIVICSPAAARSRWVDEEIRTFKRLGRADRVLTVIAAGEPHSSTVPGQESLECFAPALRFVVEPDGSLSTRPAEPMAVDLRPGKDGRANAKLKLVAGLLGIGFDELKRRDQRRQQRRMLVVTAASVAGMLVTGALAVSAWVARQDAVRNRDRAEDLIGFMLGDFRQQLEPLGKLELLRTVGDKAMAYFASQNPRDITDESLLRRAEALRQIGDVRLLLGDFEPALAAFEESRDLSARLSERAPDNTGWLFALGNAWFWVGYTHWQKGDLPAAVGPMEKYLAAAERLVELEPANRKWRLERAYALGNLGALAFARADSAAALAHYEAALGDVQALLAGAPVDLELLRTRIEFTSWLASIRESRGELAPALELHARTLGLVQELRRLEPEDRRLRDEEVLRRRLYGSALLAMGRTDDARHALESAVVSMRELVAMDAANADWQQQLALSLADLARVLIARRDCGAATPIVDEGLAISERLADRGADVSNAAKLRLSLGNSRATCLLRSGRGHEAEAVLSRSLALIAEPDETRVDFSARAQLLATSRHLLGLAARDRGQEQEALQHWNAGLALLGPERTDPGYRAIRSLLLKSLGRHDEAREIAADLQAQGYAEPAWLASLATLAAQH